jgi:hypothetical protein
MLVVIGCGRCRGLGRRDRGPSRGTGHVTGALPLVAWYGGQHPGCARSFRDTGASPSGCARSFRGTGASTPGCARSLGYGGQHPRLRPVVPGYGPAPPAAPGRSGARGPAPCSSRVTGALDLLFAIRYPGYGGQHPRLCPVVPGYGGQRPALSGSLGHLTCSLPSAIRGTGASNPLRFRATGALDLCFAIGDPWHRGTRPGTGSGAARHLPRNGPAACPGCCRLPGTPPPAARRVTWPPRSRTRNGATPAIRHQHPTSPTKRNADAEVAAQGSVISVVRPS